MINESTETELGKTQEEAEAMLKGAGLAVGEIVEEAQEKDVDKAILGTVIRQDPIPESQIARGGTVNITIAVKAKKLGRVSGRPAIRG